MPAQGQDHRDQELEALNAFRRIVQALRIAAQRAQNAAGTSAAQLYVLTHLSSAPASSINDLAGRTLTDRSSVGAVVERLVRRGLVERSRSQEDRRRAEIRLTDAGRKALRAAPPAPTSLLLGGLGRMDDVALEELTAALRQLVEHMGLTDTAAGMLFEDERLAAGRKRILPGGGP